jgi:CoA:oxalate CoA-transferase
LADDGEISCKPLDGITIIDLTSALAGPFTTLILGGLGARIIKVENPGAPDPARGNAPFIGRDGVSLKKQNADDCSLAILDRGRNKEAITLDLKKPGAQQIFAELATRADALVENFSAGVADRLGIGYAALSAINPRLVYTAISGFGANADPSRKAMDSIIQAMSGLMLTSGEAGDPPVRVGVPFGDLSGPLFAAIGTLAALMQAQRTGQGQLVDVSLLGALSAIVAIEPSDVLEALGQETRTGNYMSRLAPFGAFATLDGHLAICAPADAFAASLFSAMGRTELASDARFATRDARVAHHVELHALVQTWLAGLTTENARRLLAARGVPCGPVRTPGDAKRDPDVLARGETTRIGHPLHDAETFIGSGLPIRMSGSAVGYDRPAHEMGEDNEAVYCGLLGYSREQLAALKRDQVI